MIKQRLAVYKAYPGRKPFGFTSRKQHKEQTLSFFSSPRATRVVHPAAKVYQSPQGSYTKAMGEAVAIAKHVSGIKSFGGFAVSGVLTQKDLDEGARIRAKLSLMRKR